jgi:hypothetical protein
MAVGDYISLIHNSGAGTTFSYTLAAGVNIMFTNVGGLSWNTLLLNNWVSATTGVNYWIAETKVGSATPAVRFLAIEGQIISKTDVDLNTNGLSITGVQV